MYLGVNEKKVDYLNKELKGDKRYEYGVLSGLAHQSYFKYKVLFIYFQSSHSNTNSTQINIIKALPTISAEKLDYKNTT